MFKHMETKHSAGGIVINDNRMVLFCHPTNAPWSVWVLPKGQVDEGEQLIETAHREVTEETGLEVELLDFVGDTQPYKTVWYNPDGTKYGTVHKIVSFWLMKPIRAVHGMDAKEVDQMVYVSEEKIHKYARDKEYPLIMKALKMWDELHEI